MRRSRREVADDVAAYLDRVGSLPEFFETVCECWGLAPADEDPADFPEHYWGCPAGEFAYWCSRHPHAVLDWLEPFLQGTPPTPPLRP